MIVGAIYSDFLGRRTRRMRMLCPRENRTRLSAVGLPSLSVFFQDYLPRNENFKMHLNFTVGTGLPFGLLDNNRIFRNTYRFNAYHRVDIGFSIQLWKDGWRYSKPNHPLRFTRNSWLSLEIFNLMQVSNVASNTWIKTVTNTQYAVPNFLTSRRINLRLRMDF